MKGSGIYLIANKISGLCYVGQTKNFQKRWDGHKEKLRKNCHWNPRLQASWNKHGQQAFAFQPLEFLPLEKLLLTEREQFWMDYLPTLEMDLCNTAKAAGSPLGCKRSEETKRRISESKMGKKLQPRTPEHCAAIAASKLGHMVSEEAKAKIASSHLGRKQSEATKTKRSISNTGKTRSPETIERMRIAQKKSPETRAKLSLAHKARHAKKAQGQLGACVVLASDESAQI